MTRAFLVFGFAALLILPIFRLEYFEHWGSAEGPQIAEVRFLRDHWPGVAWNPSFNLGMKAKAVLAPGTRYAAAAISRATGWTPARSYHFYLGLTWAFGIAGVYALVKAGTGNVSFATTAAILTALLSPCFLLFPGTFADSSGGVPLRLGVLQRYGAGAHLASLAWVGWMAAFSFRGRWGLAALCAAMMVAHSVEGVLLLAACAAAMAWCWPKLRMGAALTVMLAASIPAYFMTASWWTAAWASLPQTVVTGNTWPLWLGLALPLVVMVGTHRRRDADPWLCFCGSLAFFFVVAAALQYYAGLKVFPEPIRFLPEADMFILLSGLTLAWKLPRRWRLLPVGLAFLLSSQFLTHAWDGAHYPRTARFEDRIEYDLQRWAFDHLRDTRIMVAGSTRLWWGLVGDLQQVSAGGEVGWRNPNVPPAYWQVTQGDSGEWAILWLQALGAGAVAVNDARSADVYREYRAPRKFESLPVLYSNGKGDSIYSVPRRYPALARVVETSALPANVDSLESLRAYVAAVEQGPETHTAWLNPDRIQVNAAVKPGQSIVVQVSHDRLWVAVENGREWPVTRDPAGLMRVEVSPGEHQFQMVFRPRRDAAVYGLLSLAGLSIAMWLMIRGDRK